MMSSSKVTISYIALIVLTLLSVFVNHVVSTPYLFIAIVMFIVFLKGQQVTDIFMELAHAPRQWRMLFLGYVFLVPCIVCVIYIL